MMTVRSPRVTGSSGKILKFVRRLPGMLLLGVLRGYQLVISPMTGPTCRFYPSCSEYAVRSIRRHGAFKGTGYAVWRVLRCNPWNLGGIDDVPGEEHRQI